MSDERVFELFACNVPVAGACRSILCDLQRGEYYHIPHELYALLTEHRGRTVGEIKDAQAAEDAGWIDAAFAMLIEAELGFWRAGEAGRFPPLDLTYERPEEISNAIIDTGAESRHDYGAIVAQLDALGCTHLELRFFRPVAPGELDAILSTTLESRLRSIQLVLGYAGWTEAELEQLCARHARVATITVYGAPADRIARPANRWAIVYRRQEITSAAECGQIHPGYFSTNLSAFAEAQRFNSCLNQKVSVDAAGNIKNCPSCTACYGDARTVPLAEVVRRDDFRRVWSVSKDQIAVCRDCEYRYICTDCRAYVSDPHAKPTRCSYDPYAGEWGAAG